LPTNTGVALLWKRLKLIEENGVPTLRGRVVSFFSQGDGLAIAACLEDATYPINELVYDLANLDAGFRFAGDEHRWGGRMAIACNCAVIDIDEDARQMAHGHGRQPRRDGGMPVPGETARAAL